MKEKHYRQGDVMIERVQEIDRTKPVPQKLTARNAVASTWGKRGEDYNPAIET